MYIIYLEARISNNFSPIIRINIHLRTYNEQLRVTFTIILFFFFFTRRIKYLQLRIVQFLSSLFFPRIQFFFLELSLFTFAPFYHGFSDLSNSILWRGLPCRGSTLASRKPSSGRSDRCDALQGPGDEALNFGILSICAT